MNCENVPLHYSDYADKTLSDSLRQQIDLHFAACTACREDYKQFVRAMSLLSMDLPEVELPTGFRAAILARVSAQPRSQAGPFGLLEAVRSFLIGTDGNRSRLRLVGGFAAALIAVAVVVYTANMKPGGPNGEANLSPIGATSTAAGYSGVFQGVTVGVGSDGRTYHYFDIRLPRGMQSANVAAYVLQDGRALTDDSALADQTSATPAWRESDTVSAGVDVHIPVAVVSNVPAGAVMVFLVTASPANGVGAMDKEAVFVPLDTVSPGAITAGGSLFDTVKALAALTQQPIVLDSKAMAHATYFKSNSVPAGAPGVVATALATDPGLTTVSSNGMTIVTGQ